MPMRQLRWFTICLLAALAACAQPAMAQTWPARPITMVVPFPPGPALDLVARLVGIKLGEALGQTIVIENRTGANGMIGSNLVARAAARRLYAADEHGQHPRHRRLSDEKSELRPDQGFHPDRGRGRAGDLPGRQRRAAGQLGRPSSSLMPRRIRASCPTAPRASARCST